MRAGETGATGGRALSIEPTNRDLMTGGDQSDRASIAQIRFLTLIAFENGGDIVAEIGKVYFAIGLLDPFGEGDRHAIVLIRRDGDAAFALIPRHNVECVMYPSRPINALGEQRIAIELCSGAWVLAQRFPEAEINDANISAVL